MKLADQNLKFIENDEKHTIVCVLTGYVKTGDSSYDIPGVFNKALTKIRKKGQWYQQMTFVGKAKCSKGDIYDIKKGRKIAEARARVKAYKYMTKLLQKVVENLNTITNDIQREQYKMEESVNKEELRLQELTF